MEAAHGIGNTALMSDLNWTYLDLYRFTLICIRLCRVFVGFATDLHQVTPIYVSLYPFTSTHVIAMAVTLHCHASAVALP